MWKTVFGREGSERKKKICVMWQGRHGATEINRRAGRQAIVAKVMRFRVDNDIFRVIVEKVLYGRV